MTTVVSYLSTYVIGTTAIIFTEAKIKTKCAMFSVIKIYPKILE